MSKISRRDLPIFFGLFVLNLITLRWQFEGLFFTWDYLKTIFILAIVLLFFLVHAGDKEFDKRNYYSWGTYRILWVFVVYSFLSVIWGGVEDVPYALKYLPKLLLVIFFLYLFYHSFDEELTRRFLRVLEGYFVVFLFFSIVSEIYLRNYILPVYIGDPRFQGFEGVHETKFMALLISNYFFGKFIFGRKKLDLFLFVVGFIILVLTLQRIVILGSVVGLLVTYYLMQPKKEVIRRLAKTALASAALLGILVYLFFYYTPVSRRMFLSEGADVSALHYLERLEVGKAYSLVNLQGRPELWAIINARPVTFIGNGYGSVGLVSDELFGSYVEMHNDYLKVLFELGYLGIILYAVFIASILLLIWRYLVSRHPTTARYPNLLASGLGIMLGLPIIGMFDNAIDHFHQFFLVGFVLVILFEKANQIKDQSYMEG